VRALAGEGTASREVAKIAKIAKIAKSSAQPFDAASHQSRPLNLGVAVCGEARNYFCRAAVIGQLHENVGSKSRDPQPP
jgi:hypothetical protein